MSTTKGSGTIFNVPEAEGKERVQLETTAATAEIEAPTASIARNVEENAEHVHDAACDAANQAKSKGPSLTGEPPSAVDQLHQQAKKTTDDAVAEGQRDIEAAKNTGAGLIDQAKTLVSNAVSTGQSYLPGSSVGGHGLRKGETDETKTGIVSSIQTGASAAVETTKEYLAAAQKIVEPHVDHAKGVAQGYLGTAGKQGSQTTMETTPASSKGVPAKSAPLETGRHAVESPYDAAK